MKNYIYILIFSLTIVACNSPLSDETINPAKAENFPRWLKQGAYRTHQTSGIAFINSENSRKTFILSDDTGILHKLVITADTVFNFTKIQFSPEVKALLDTFPKPDFEDICCDPHTGSFYLSIEGNKPDPKLYAGIYKLSFTADLTVLSNMEKLNITPEGDFKKYLAPNVSYEGLAADSRYLYLGLEGFQTGSFFADSSVIFVVDKSTLKIVKEISTKPLGIHTVCGLYSDKDLSLYGIDRNNRKLFHIILNDNLDVKSRGLTEVGISIPGYKQYAYTAALEAVTADDQGSFYLVDDPWKSFFVPSDEVLSNLDSVTVSNFKNFIPIIYKYKL